MRVFINNIKSLYCSTGNCKTDELKKQQDEQNKRYAETIAENLKHSVSLNTPTSFYTSGIYGTNNCNKFVTANTKSQTDIALEAVEPVLSQGGEPTTPKNNTTTSPYCIEGFDNLSSKYNKKYIILLVLIIICLICWIYYTILSIV